MEPKRVQMHHQKFHKFAILMIHSKNTYSPWKSTQRTVFPNISKPLKRGSETEKQPPKDASQQAAKSTFLRYRNVVRKIRN